MAGKLTVLPSTIDRSVNFVEERLQGFLESRFVRKCDDYFIGYLSSHTGCNRGCGFCHLTVMGQTSFRSSSISQFHDQAVKILGHYEKELNKGQPSAKYMHWNFMARGEPLANHVLLEDSAYLLGTLGREARRHNLPSKFNVSTILPNTFKGSLVETFPVITPTIYYSLYSVNEDFRRKWLPTAMQVPAALRLLKEYQDFSKKVVKIHHALIAGENDEAQDAWDICAALNTAGLRCEFNLVRYNPASDIQGAEADAEKRCNYLSVLKLCHNFMGKVQVIPRVGFDVKASCGMFHAGETSGV